MDNNRGKALGYRKAISMLKSHKYPITDVKQIDQINYIGDGIKKKNLRIFIDWSYEEN